MSRKTIRIKELRAGNEIFRSSGISYVKVTRDGEAGVLEIPIKSNGVAEVIERVRREEPKPPSRPLAVDPNSPIGKQMKFSGKTVVMAPDLGDADYVAAMERFQQDLSLEIVLVGLDIPLVDANGAEVTDRDQKLAILKGLGMTVAQYQQIVNDIQELTTLTDKDREGFFGVSSASGVTTGA